MRRIAFLILIVSLSITAFSQEKQTRKEKRLAKRSAAYNEAVELVKTGEFIFVADRAFPQGYQPVELSSHTAELEIRQDTAEAYLPYFGRSFNAGYGDGGGIKFEGIAEDYLVEFDDEKQVIHIKFKGKSDNNNYTCSFTINSKSSASLFILASNRSGISYNGRIESIESKKKKKK